MIKDYVYSRHQTENEGCESDSTYPQHVEQVVMFPHICLCFIHLQDTRHSVSWFDSVFSQWPHMTCFRYILKKKKTGMCNVMQHLVFHPAWFKMKSKLTLQSAKMTLGAWTLFHLAAFLIMASASSTRPFESSQRGDSGISLSHYTTQTQQTVSDNAPKAMRRS